MSREHAVRPAGCTCGWAQVHMDMPWQLVSKDPNCAVHAAKTAADAGNMGLEAPKRAVRGRW